MADSNVIVSALANGTLSVRGLRTGTSLASFSQCHCAANGLAGIGGPHSLNGASFDFLAAAQRHRPAVHFWRWGKESPELQCATPEKLGAILVTSDGLHLIGGGESGAIYLWQLCSGKLLTVCKAHHRAVTSLVESDDGAHLVSGGDDALVLVYSMLDLFDTKRARRRAVHTWAEHTLSVTALHCGRGGANARVLSCSMDRTCKVWSIPLGSMLFSVAFPCGLRTVVADTLETLLLAGGEDGRVFALPLTEDGSGRGASRLGEAPPPPPAFEGHTAAVGCLALSENGEMLVSGSEDGTTRLWHVSSRQLLNTFSTAPQKGGEGAVVAVTLLPRPESIFRSRGSRATVALAPLAPLHKYPFSTYKERGERSNVRVRPSVTADRKRHREEQSSSDVGDGDSSAATAAADAFAEAQLLHKEIAHLREENAKWKELNAKLYAEAVENTR